MLLLLTLKSKDGCGLLQFNTDTGEANQLYYDEEEFDYTSGIVYSGNWLCFGIHHEKKPDQIYIGHAFEKDIFNTFDCVNSNAIGNIISIFPGKLYLDSNLSNSICCIDFDTVNLSYFSDAIHYTLNEKINYQIRSLYAYNTTWFVASNYYNQIIDLTNDRIVFSDIYDPRCIFFNSNHRMCFIEAEKGLFHCGNEIIYVGGTPTAAIEDRLLGGYWIATNGNLIFFDYNGDSLITHDLSEWVIEVNNMIEVEGYNR
jgi:hypothetical protein